MNKDNVRLVIGALLHDIGKVIYRTGDDPRKHAQSGADCLKEKAALDDPDVLACVRYHHGNALRNANVPVDSYAYLVYMADNIASAADRREGDEAESGFDLSTPLQPVFNILNGNKENKYYSPYKINVEKDINFPVDEKIPFDREVYRKIEDNITDNLRGLMWTEEYINSLLEVLEEELSFIPSSTSRREIPDISLFDHLKMTAAIALDENKYLESQGEHDYKKVLFNRAGEFYSVEAFRLASLDISGIQKFIYTITTKNALKTLRARSFYLEILMEHLVDELLESLGLCRVNMIYSGGGRCYLLLPNTKETEDGFREFLKETNDWFLNRFGTQLYIAGASVPCSANSLKNIPEGSYKNLFHELSKAISGMKNHRYTAMQILDLNRGGAVKDHTRECRVCHNVGAVDENNLCGTCAAIEKFSSKVLYSDFFSVVRKEIPDSLPLPGGYSLISDDEGSLRRRMQNDPDFVRAYGKNKAYTGSHMAAKLWVGNYTTRSTFEEFAEESRGISRVGILRADVDNLGTAFVSGFDYPENHNRCVTISRTASFSRQMSLFFKLHINKILSHPEFTLDGRKKDQRNVTIVYSGGDDIFLVGAWNEIVEAAIDLRRNLEKYTEGTLTLSAGIGLYTATYPISASAVEVEREVDESKSLPLKQALTFLEDGESHTVRSGDKRIEVSDGTYSWKELEEKVIGEKFRTISSYFSFVKNSGTTDDPDRQADVRDQRGNSFLYHLLEFIRRKDEKLNFARYIYLLARMEPDEHAPREVREAYLNFRDHMLAWFQQENDRRQLKTAIELYVYLNRSGEGEK